MWLEDDLGRINTQFGEAVKKALEERGWSHQRAHVNVGVPGATIGRMALGIVPGEDHIIKWAMGLKEPINDWLELAGYEPIPPEKLGPPAKFINKNLVAVDDILVYLRQQGSTLDDEDLREIADLVRKTREDLRKRKKDEAT